MKKSLLALGVLGAFSGLAFAASNVTLYGVIEEGVLVTKAKDTSAKVELKSGFDSGSRWGIKGVEDLGNGVNVGFILEQGFNADDGAEMTSGSQFARETFLYVTGGFGKFGAGRTGTLSSGAQSNNILTGWALGTGYGNSSWTSEIGTSFSRTSNTLAYNTPSFSGLTLHAMYSNGMSSDTEKWAKNAHYYGVGAKYDANNIRSSLIFEAVDKKGTETADKAAEEPVYKVDFGFEYKAGAVTPMIAYQWASQDKGKKTNMIGLSAKASVAGGTLMAGTRYLFGKDESIDTSKGATDKIRTWNIGAAYAYPISKRTTLKAFAGYTDSYKAWKDTDNAVYNGYQAYFAMTHTF